jgi:hypothetical protein
MMMPMMIPTKNAIIRQLNWGSMFTVAITCLPFLLAHPDLYTTMTHHPLSTLGEIDFYHFHPPKD